MNPNFRIFSYIGTGSDLSLGGELIGFKPKYVKVSNRTSRDCFEWFEGMADDSAIKMGAAGTRTLVTSNGITPAVNGFALGADTDVNVAGEYLDIMVLG